MPFCFSTESKLHLPSILIYFLRFAFAVSVLTLHHGAADPERRRNAAGFCSNSRTRIVDSIAEDGLFFKLLIIKSGSSSVVERQLPKLNVAGSIPVSRSNLLRTTPPQLRRSYRTSCTFITRHVIVSSAFTSI